MTSVKEIESAIRQLPDSEKKSLALKINDLYWDAWDEQLAGDITSGRLDDLIAETEKEINEGNVKPLDEVIRDS
ncbi:MAG: hypothetical protein KJT03_14680 [Verrucomicrobiae bacterium]|nr:hypothetical protein [Verrucomicrobiae bacterium]